MSGSPQLRVHLLGRFQVAIGQRIVAPSAWNQQSAAMIVKLLALAPQHRLHREQLMDMLWPDADPGPAANRLRVRVHAARRILAELDGSTPFIRREGSVVVLGPPDLVWTDVGAFDHSVAQAWESSDPVVAEEALAYYAGDLLPGDPYDDGLADLRSRLRIDYLTLLTRLAEMYEQRGELERAIPAWQRLLVSEPTQERAHVRVMQLYARTDQAQQAIAQYDRLAAVLAYELDAEPEQSTGELLAAILEGRYQEGVAASNPSTATLGTPPENRTSGLPPSLDELIGRDREVAVIHRMLTTLRLVTLTGTGGIGKTRLALAVADRLMDTLPDGVVYVSLASVQDPRLVDAAIAQSLHVSDQRGKSALDLITAFARDKRLVLVIDNFEHVIDAASTLAEILSACPYVRILVTSRARLHLNGEREYAVAPLSLPDPLVDNPIAIQVCYPGVELFIRRAREANPSFQMDAEDAASIVAICQLLHGIPLAIELAAARSKVLPPSAILARLDQPLAILTGGPRDAPMRQQTMRNTIQWSYDLLMPEEQTLLHWLSVFAGGWTLAAAEGVVTDDELNVLDALTSLVDKSLVQQDDRIGDSLRFSLLIPIQEFGLECLKASGEAYMARARHAQYFAGLAAPTAELVEGPNAIAWLDHLEVEHDNFRAVVAWAIDSCETEMATRLAGALWEFWAARGYLNEGRRWLEAVLGMAGGSETAAHAEAMRGAGELARRQGDLEDAATWMHECVAEFGRLSDDLGVARALNHIGILAMIRGQYDEACQFYEQSLAAAQRVENRGLVARVLNNRGGIAILRRDYEHARLLIEEAVELHRSVGNQRGLALAVGNLGALAHDRGDYKRSLQLKEEGLALFRSQGDRVQIAQSLSNLGTLALAVGDYDQARYRHEEGLALSRELGDKAQIAAQIRFLGHVALARGDAYRAAVLFGAEEVLRESVSWNSATPWTRELYERAIADLRATLDGETLASAWAKGRRMTADEAVDYALTDGGEL